MAKDKNTTCITIITDRTGETRQCKLKIKSNNLCRIHLNKKEKDKKKDKDIEKKETVEPQKFDTIYLDRIFPHNLMNLYNSWSEIDQKEYIELAEETWPITILVNTITHQINNSNMENPYPIYPHNPFTRRPFTPKELLTLKQKIKSLNMPINISLKLLLEQPEKSINYIYKETLGYLDRHSILLMSLFQQYLRFMIINYKNSQNNHIGFWVNKTQKLTHFEEMYNSFKEVPYQIFNRGQIINNPYREYLKYVLKNYIIDECQPTDDQFCEYILKD